PPPYAPPPAYAPPAAPPRFGAAPLVWGYLAPIPSYRWQAVIVFALYWFFFFPGLIANIIYWNKAKNVQAATGIAPRGKGCLTFMLVCALLFLLLSLGVAALA
ncbi:MAG: hypothetical protein QM692_12525, partial [Thermomicrobiales bacterium]